MNKQLINNADVPVPRALSTIPQKNNTFPPRSKGAGCISDPKGVLYSPTISGLEETLSVSARRLNKSDIEDVQYAHPG